MVDIKLFKLFCFSASFKVLINYYIIFYIYYISENTQKENFLTLPFLNFTPLNCTFGPSLVELYCPLRRISNSHPHLSNIHPHPPDKLAITTSSTLFELLYFGSSNRPLLEANSSLGESLVENFND